MACDTCGLLGSAESRGLSVLWVRPDGGVEWCLGSRRGGIRKVGRTGRLSLSVKVVGWRSLSPEVFLGVSCVEESSLESGIARGLGIGGRTDATCGTLSVDAALGERTNR